MFDAGEDGGEESTDQQYCWGDFFSRDVQDTYYISPTELPCHVTQWTISRTLSSVEQIHQNWEIF